MPVLKKSNDSVQILKRIEDNPSNLQLVNSAFADVLKTFNTSASLFASIADTQKKLAETIVTTIAPIQEMNKAILGLAETQRTLFNFKPILPNFAEILPKNNSIVAAVQSGFKMTELFKLPDLSFLTEPFRRISEGFKFLIPQTFFNGITNVLNSVGNIANIIGNSVKQTLEPFFRLAKSNFYIIVYASKGDKVALHHLGKIWWRLGLRYLEIERLKGRQPTKREFEFLVQEICWEVLEEVDKRGSSWLEVARVVYYALIAKLFADYLEVIQNENFTEATEAKLVNGNYKHKISIYKDEQNNQHLFIKTIAQELQVSPQTVRNWVKSGQVLGIKVSYFSRMKQALVPTFLLPYEPNLLTQLKDIKDKQDMKRKHQIEGYFTVTQVASWYNISRKTLERWDKQGILVPKRVNGIRYYSQSQRDQVPNILMNNQSPKIKSLLASRSLILN